MITWTPGNITEEELWARWLHSEAVRGFESGAIGPDVFAQSTIDEFELSVSPAEFLSAFETWIDGLFDGVEELIAALTPSFRLATMSNTNATHWPKLTQQMGLGSLIDTHFPSHQTGLLKPDREAFEHVIDQLDCPAHRILFFDDNQLNVSAAIDAGLRATVVKGPSDIRTELHRLELLPSP